MRGPGLAVTINEPASERAKQDQQKQVNGSRVTAGSGPEQPKALFGTSMQSQAPAICKQQAPYEQDADEY
jgi:hypothetical protein